MNRDKKYEIIKGPYSLKELVAKEKFPQMLQVTKGFYAPTEKETISEGQIMVAYFVKRIKVVRAVARNEVFSIPLNSSMKFSILRKEGVQPFYKTAADLASAPVMPDVVACRSVTLDNQGQVIRPGTVLFPVMDKKGVKQKLKIGGQKPIKFLSTRGEKLKVPSDSESGFTTHLEDTKLYISEIIQHFPLPVKVRCMTSGKNFLGTNFLHELTLKETKEEASLIGGFKLDEDEEDYLSKCPFDLPLDLLVEVVCVKAHDNNEQFSMYEEVRTTYESKRSRVAPYKKLLSNCNTHDRAQMELYNTVREEMSEHVVDVEVPENIYDEIIPYECVGTSKPPPKNTGPSLPPKGIKPDMDYVQLTKSTPEKDPPITSPKPSIVPQQLPSSGSYQPLQPMPSTYIESAYQPLNNKVPSEETANIPTSDRVEQEMPATARQLQEEYPDYDIPRCHPPKKKTSADDMERRITPPSTKQPPPVFPKTKKTPPPAPIRRSSELSQEAKEKPPTAPRPTFVRRHSEIPADAKDKPPQICGEHTPPHIPSQPLARQIISQSPPSRVLPQLPPSHITLQSPPSHAPLQSPPSHAPLQSPPSHVPPQSPATHIPPQSPATHIPQQPPIITPNPPNPEENIAFLKTLDCHSILDLIYVMKLSQYQDQFIQEHVDGELLSCMEDTELVELGITSSLHRKRFLKIIEGKHSAKLYLEEGDPYGTVTKKHPLDK